MDGRNRDYFTSILLETRRLSELPSALSVVIGRAEELISAGYSKEYGNLEYHLVQTTPLYSALFDFVKKGSPAHCSIFFSYFPSPLEIEMLVFSKIYQIYFIGEITNPETVSYLNKLQKHLIPIEIARINVDL